MDWFFQKISTLDFLSKDRVVKSWFKKSVLKSVGLKVPHSSYRDHPFKTSACLRGGGGVHIADGQKVTVHKDQKSPS